MLSPKTWCALAFVLKPGLFLFKQLIQRRYLHILNWGMGVESTAILLRWLLEPECRPFVNLADLVVLAAQTGDEMPNTQTLCETYLFPLLRDHRIRVVQVAKASASKRDGYVVLSDTRTPQTLHIEGHFKLSQNLMLSGTVPRLGRPHICAQRWKGEVLDAWLADNIDDAFGPYLGYNCEESKRVAKSDGYSCRGFDYIYPLVDWGWNRQDCLQYLYRQWGTWFAKSACSFCPFQECGIAVERFQQDPDAAAQVLLMEQNALAHNPRMHLFSSGTAYDLVLKHNLQKVLERYEQRLAQETWALYHVYRIYRQLPVKDKPEKFRVDADRYNCVLTKGDRPYIDICLAELAQRYGKSVIEQHGQRFYVHERIEKQYPAWEEFFVATIHQAEDKCRNLSKFRERWYALTGDTIELKLGESLQLSLL
jgi:hypothetical protein